MSPVYGGPNAPCQRDVCAGKPAHKGGAHLDSSSELWDGPSTTINALPYSSRDAAREIQRLVPEEHRHAVDVAIYEMAREILRLRKQVAHVQVDADRKVAAALKRSEDCEAHGADIRYEQHQAHYFNVHADQLDQERVSFRSAVTSIEQSFQEVLARVKEGRPTPTVEEIARKVLDYCAAAHKNADRARKRFNPPTLADCDQAGKCEHPATEPHAACRALAEKAQVAA